MLNINVALWMRALTRLFRKLWSWLERSLGKTEAILNIVGYHIDNDPAPILVLQPTLEMAQAFSKDRVAAGLIKSTPALRGKVKDPRSRDSGNTTLHKIFPGGAITMVGANSPSGLASRPIRIVLCDEVDRYPPSAGSEGDPIQLARKRSRYLLEPQSHHG